MEGSSRHNGASRQRLAPDGGEDGADMPSSPPDNSIEEEVNGDIPTAELTAPAPQPLTARGNNHAFEGPAWSDLMENDIAENVDFGGEVTRMRSMWGLYQPPPLQFDEPLGTLAEELQRIGRECPMPRPSRKRPAQEAGSPEAKRPRLGHPGKTIA